MPTGRVPPSARRRAESLMYDMARVERLAAPVTNKDTGEVATKRTLLYEGKCKVQTYEGYETNTEAGGKINTSQRYSLHVPVNSFAPTIGDVVTVLAAQMDQGLVGREYRVVSLLHKSLATAYRLGIEEMV